MVDSEKQFYLRAGMEFQSQHTIVFIYVCVHCFSPVYVLLLCIRYIVSSWKRGREKMCSLVLKVKLFFLPPFAYTEHYLNVSL